MAKDQPSTSHSQPEEQKRSRVLVVEDGSADVFLIKEAIEAAGIDSELHIVEDGEQAVEIKRDSAGKPENKPVRRIQPTKVSGYDFYVLSGEDTHDLDRKGIRVAFSYSRSELVLGIPAQ